MYELIRVECVEVTGSVVVTGTDSLFDALANMSPTPAVPGGTVLHARLNSTGTHVVCGMKDCGTRMAYVGHPTAEEILQSEQTSTVALACIQFLPGWAPGHDGIWAFSTYAKLRKHRGRSIKVRRYPMNDGTGPLNDVMNSYYDRLPTRAKCAQCGFANTLTAEDLGVPRVVLVPASPMSPGKTVAPPR